MLVLTRKVGEEIFVNDEICISVVRIRGNRVRLGISAPASVRIRRREMAPCSKRPEPIASAVAARH